jgi:hypothetical protein
VFPAGTLNPLLVVNAGQLINTVPVAVVPSARYTVSVTCVVATVLDVCAVSNGRGNAIIPIASKHASNSSTNLFSSGIHRIVALLVQIKLKLP